MPLVLATSENLPREKVPGREIIYFFLKAEIKIQCLLSLLVAILGCRILMTVYSVSFHSTWHWMLAEMVFTEVTVVVCWHELQLCGIGLVIYLPTLNFKNKKPTCCTLHLKYFVISLIFLITLICSNEKFAFVGYFLPPFQVCALKFQLGGLSWFGINYFLVASLELCQLWWERLLLCGKAVRSF